MPKGVFNKKKHTLKTKGGWKTREVDGRSKLGKELRNEVKRIKSGKAKYKPLPAN
jgi:hypothetical protein